VQSNQLQLDLKSNRDASIPSERFVLFAANRDSSFSGHLVHQIDHQNIDSTKQPTYRYRIPSRHESVVANVLACKHLLLNPQVGSFCFCNLKFFLSQICNDSDFGRLQLVCASNDTSASRHMVLCGP
jgi:hypothetical protein